MFKDKLGGKTMIEFYALRAKTYAYLLDDNTETKRAEGYGKMHNKKRDYV